MSRGLVTSFVVLVAAAIALPVHAQVIESIAASDPFLVQMAPGPLAEGVKPYTDRVHVFKGVPAALVGAQYIQMSNNLKNNPGFELRITVGQAGTLYLILDNRVGTNSKDPATSPDPVAAHMNWVNEAGFFDTGMKMGLDENADGSVNNYYTVFSLQVTPGVTVLKAQFDLFFGGPQDRNMYVVAAAATRKATNPVPADGKSVAAFPLLQWTPGVGAVTHHVYVGTSPQLGPADLIGPNVSQPFFQYSWALIPDTTYYWRVDEVEADKVTVVTGDVWTFKATSLTAFAPVPPDGAPWVGTDATLSWKPGMNALLHNLYFGTDKAAVENGTGDTLRGTVYFMEWQPPLLEPNTTYFWRVDEVAADDSTEIGPVWSFSTVRSIEIGDPNLLGWWKMDEGVGAIAVDWSGHGHHARFAKPAPTWATGFAGGALQCAGNGDSAMCADGSFLNGLDALTITAWVKSDVTQTDKGFLIFESPIGNDDRCIRYDAAGVTGGGSNVLKMGVTASTNGTSTTAQLESSNDSQTTDWQHLAMVWANGQGLTLYIDGELDSPTFGGDAAIGQLSGCSTVIIGKGSKDILDSSWDGLVDELRIYNKALTPKEIQGVMRGDPSLAWDPNPVNGATANVFDALPLRWQAGDKAVAHDIYLGDDRTAVSEATVSDTTGVYRGRQNDTSYLPAPPLELVVRYYWRIDEVNNDGTINQGPVWDFMLDD